MTTRSAVAKAVMRPLRPFSGSVRCEIDDSAPDGKLVCIRFTPEQLAHHGEVRRGLRGLFGRIR
jgi:hypothetical protein